MTEESTRNGDVPPWDAKLNQPKRGRIRRWLMWAGLLGLVALVGYGLRPQPCEVETGKVVRGPLTVHVSEEGKTRIRNRYVVSAPVAGRMRRVTLKAGDPVKAGETVLTTFEPVRAPLLDARTRTEMEARLSGTDAAERRAKEAVDMANAAAEFARASWKRIRENGVPGSISATDRDMAELAATLRAGEARAAGFALDVARYEKAQAAAALKDMPQADGAGLAPVEVRAPVSGNVLKVMQESEAVIAQGTPLLEIGDPADMEIEAEILSRDAVSIQPGALVSVEQWGGEQALEARVRRVEPAAFTKISALGVEEQRVIVLSDLIMPPGGAHGLGDRFRVEVRVKVWHRDDALLIPAGALFRQGNRWQTYVYDGGKARLVEVMAGRSDGVFTEVLGGIGLGTEVLLHPPDAVKDGTQLKKR